MVHKLSILWPKVPHFQSTMCNIRVPACSKYHCMDCVLPECFRCQTRAPFPKNYVKVQGQDGEYYCCQKCRAADSRVCSECRTPKIYADFRKLTRGTHAKMCKECERPFCVNCGTAYPAHDEAWGAKNRGPYYCSQLCKYPVCDFAGCGRERPTSNGDAYTFWKMPVWRCAQHGQKKQR